MGKNNTVIKQWLSDKERFASFVNGALFQGKAVFQADTLEPADGQQGVALKSIRGKDISVERYRDITMTARDATRIIIVACENQEEIHYAMPVRNMLYDALSYAEQVSSIRRKRRRGRQLKNSAEFLSGLKREDRLIPTLTLVFYYGEAQWDGQKDLHGLLGINREEYKLLREYIPNYTINLIDPREIEDLRCFDTDLQMVFGMLQYRKSKAELKKYVKENEAFFKNVDEETCAAVKVMLGSEKLFQHMEKNEKGGMDMCQALDDIYQDGIDRGMILGEKRGIEQGMQRGMQEKLVELVKKKLALGQSVENIAEDLVESAEVIEALARQICA